MSRPLALPAPLVWTAAYVLAVGIGASATFPDETLAIVWPASGVAVLWLLGRHGPDLAINAALLAVVTFGASLAAGMGLAFTGFLVAMNVAQAVSGALLLRRLCPELWGAGGTATFDSVGRIFRLLIVSVVSSLLSAAVVSAGVAWLIAPPSALDVSTYWGRNIYGCLAIVSLLHLVGHAWHFRDHPVLARHRAPELVALLAVTLLISGIAFLQSGLPVAYVPAIVTIWAGLRFAPPIVAVHGVATGAFAIGATMAGLGPFALVSDQSVRGLLVQLLLIILVLEGLSIAAVRQHQRQLLRDARDRTALLATITDSIGPGLVVLDRAGRPVRHNQAAEALLAMRPSAGDSTDPAAVEVADAWPSVWSHCAAHEGPGQLDLRLEGGAETLIVEVRSTPLSWEGGRSGTVVLLTDVTAERTARDGLTAFAGTVAHDLRGPLTRVRGWSQALAEELAAEEADLDLVATMVDRVVAASGRMDDLIGDLLAHAVSRDGALHPTTVPVDRVTAQVAQTLGAESQVVVRDRVEVHADPGLVRHVMTNLVGNALKYVAPGTEPHVSLRARPAGEMIEIRLADNGIGIPEEQRDKVFDQFHRAHTDYPGTGLGLSICRTIVERHGGQIHAEASEGGGTCIVFTLPAPPRASGEPEADDDHAYGQERPASGRPEPQPPRAERRARQQPADDREVTRR